MWYALPLQTKRLAIALCLVLIFAGVLGALLGLYWSAEYTNCLVVRGGFQKLLAQIPCATGP